MKAIVYEQYGSADVLKLAEVATPVPTDDQVFVKIHAVSINGSDKEGLVGKPLYARFRGLRKPGNPILGSDIAGVVESVGRNVIEFKPGDHVFGEIPGYHNGFAEYACLPESSLLPKPDSLTFAQASTIPQAGVIALQGIRDKGKIQAGQKVLINGAGGGGGTFAVQLAKLYGANVTGVDNAYKQDYMRSLGADHVIDYTHQDFSKNGIQYDMILDLTAYRSVFAYQRALASNGTYYFVGGSVGVMFQILLLGPIIKKTADKNIRILMVQPKREDLISITSLCESGKIIPVIDREYPFDQVPEAMRYVEEGRAKGKVVIIVDTP